MMKLLKFGLTNALFMVLVVVSEIESGHGAQASLESKNHQGWWLFLSSFPLSFDFDVR
jgi:hypothetical protein